MDTIKTAIESIAKLDPAELERRLADIDREGQTIRQLLRLARRHARKAVSLSRAKEGTP